MGAREAPALMCVGLVILAVVCFIGGFLGLGLKGDLFDPASDALMGPAPAQGQAESLTKGVGQ